MFKIKDLQKLKKLVKSELESELRITKAIYNGIGGTDKELYPYDYMLKIQSNSIQLDKGKVTTEDLARITNLTTDVKPIGSKLKVSGTTKPTYIGSRYDEFASVVFDLIYYIPVDEVDEAIIRVKTKNRLTKLVMPEGYDIFTFSLDCKLMEQFKAGTLTMEQVVEGSIGNCEI